MARILMLLILFSLAVAGTSIGLGLRGSPASVETASAPRTTPAPAAAPGSATATKVRIGIYDSRAIAIAYAGSKYNDLSAKMKEYQQAKDAGDQAKVKELEAWGQQRQRELNRQGFARMPVTDLLEPVKDRLPALAKERGVDVIVFECNYLGPDVERIDVTLDLVKLYEPSEKTMKWITEAMKIEPKGLDELNNDNP